MHINFFQFQLVMNQLAVVLMRTAHFAFLLCMIFVNHIKSAAGAKTYYAQHLGPGDYYGHDAQERKGQWHGLGAELLGLSGEVRQRDYFALCDNRDPATGKQLTPETKRNRRVLTDFTFDAPKSVSLALQFGGTDGRGDGRILDAFQETVRETMAEMERHAMTRVRKGGADHDRPTANMVWSEHIHQTARPVTGRDGSTSVDLQLHCHATVFNATYDTVEERWKAIQLGNIVRDKGLSQAKFHSRLAHKLAELGYGITRDGNSFALAGIDRATVEKFSRRTEVIEAEAVRRGITDAKVKGDLGRKTREKKAVAPKPMSELREEWQSRLSEDERAAIIAAGRGGETTTLSASEGMDFAVEHCFERNSAIPERELLKTALIHSVGNAPVGEVMAQVNRADLIRKDKLGQTYVTTRQVRQEELRMTSFVREGRGRHKRLGSVMGDLSLSPEQEAAMTRMLASRDAVTALSSGAGTGKTTTMKAVAKGIEKSGKKLFAFAPSADASRGVQRSEGFTNADTVEKLLTDEKLQRRLPGNVVWIDEAGLVSTPDMLRVFELAREREFRIVLSGDTQQHHAVRRGDALRILERDAGLNVARLSEIRRQTNAGYRQAVASISKGDRLAGDGRTHFAHGMEALDRLGAVIEVEGEERHTRMAQDYVAAVAEKKGRDFKTALVVAPTHSEGQKVTDAIRKALKEDGRLGSREETVTSLRPLGLTDAERRDYANYAPGQVVRINQNLRNFVRGEKVTVTGAGKDALRVERADGQAATLLLKDAKRFDVFQPRPIQLARGDKLRITQNGFTEASRLGTRSVASHLDNGALYEVAGFTDSGITLTNGFVIPKDYGGFTHGYVVTSHASQGKTVDKVLIALGEESFAAANREQLYVSVSRGRESVKLYTDDKAAMLDAVRASAARLSASELLEERPTRKPSVMERLRGMRLVHRAYAAVRERIVSAEREVRGGIGY